jgi:hypothetical protein
VVGQRGSGVGDIDYERLTESEVRNMLLWYLMEEIENDW